MFEVYSLNTGRVQRRCRDTITANRIACDLTAVWSWINGERFDYRVENTDRNSTPQREATSTQDKNTVKANG